MLAQGYLTFGPFNVVVRPTTYSNFLVIFHNCIAAFSNCVRRGYFFKNHYVFGQKLRNQSQNQVEGFFCLKDHSFFEKKIEKSESESK